MKTRNLENGLAYVGALVVLMGVLAAANSAFAAESVDNDRAVVAENDAAVEAINGAEKAMKETADAAAKSLEIENNFDLENQLSDISSTLIAANK
ncbi:MAG: hypothetical protein ACR2RD_10830 [Woeseiaceae bacterium]